MHDVLDLRDLVPDEAEELLVSGYPVGDLLPRAQRAAAAADLDELRLIEAALGALTRRDDWAYDEPRDEAAMLAPLAGMATTPVDRLALPDRMRGAWRGRAVGNALGKPVEGLDRTEVEIYLRAAGQWPMTDYLPLLSPLPDGVARLHPSAPVATRGAFTDIPRDDDLDWTVLALWVLERHGRGFTTEQLAAAWLDRMPFTQTYTAERAAYRNLIAGLAPPETATVANPYREWIGALIRTDAYGYVNPGDPGAAATLALVDARLSHTGNGIYGAMWAAALSAAALTATSAREALELALPVVPPASRLAEALRMVLELHASGADHVAALDAVDTRLGRYAWVHTIPNAALISTGLLWGADLLGAVGIAIEGGRDTDSNGATVGGVHGALHGSASVPLTSELSSPLRLRSAVRDFDRVTVDELAERTLRLVPGG